MVEQMVKDYETRVIQWVDKVFPPGTRADALKHWAQVGAPFLVAWLVLFLLMFCCKRCGRGRSERTMKAPGRDYRMPRSEFEENPGSYFRGLRKRNH
ncbi:hypothetical protein DCAR_0727389 [Daucus carota subsp. sativus]|uniref:Uncharacterized protein n=1 Tax=Daucus carota subsp. sativus TaxID=79200 RepID=A0A164SW76_DAUCS|nr:hypothetical protein DCAR_0727389 [Daucus carota subsp. sativus]